MIPIIETPEGSSEIAESRTRTGKLFNMGGDKRRAKNTIGVVHVPDDVPAWEAGGSFNWLDIDTDLELQGGVWRAKQVWNTTFVDPNVLGFDYLSKVSGDVQVRVTKINRQPIGSIGPLPTVRIDTNRVWFDDVVPGLSFSFLFLPAGVIAERILTSSTRGSRPVEIEWELARVSDEGVKIGASTLGKDNFDRSDVGRNSDIERNKSRPVEIDQSRTDDVLGQGRTRFLHTEELTGRTVKIDPQTRQRSFVDEFVFPARFNG